MLSEEDEEEAEGKESLLPDASDKSYTALPVSVAAHIPKSVSSKCVRFTKTYILLAHLSLAVVSFTIINSCHF